MTPVFRFCITIMFLSLPEPRAEVSKYAPKMITMKIDPDKIREVIGSGGKVIQKYRCRYRCKDRH